MGDGEGEGEGGEGEGEGDMAALKVWTRAARPEPAVPINQSAEGKRDMKGAWNGQGPVAVLMQQELRNLDHL